MLQKALNRGKRKLYLQYLMLIFREWEVLTLLVFSNLCLYHRLKGWFSNIVVELRNHPGCSVNMQIPALHPVVLILEI